MSPGDFTTKMSAKDIIVNIKSEPLDSSFTTPQHNAPSYDELQQIRVDDNNGLADLNTMVPSALNIGIIPDIEGICPQPAPLSAPLCHSMVQQSPPLLRRYETDAMMRQRLFTTLKHSFPGSALMKALYFCSSELNTNDRFV